MLVYSNVTILTGFTVSTSVATWTITRVVIVRKVFQTDSSVDTVVVVVTHPS